MTFTSKLTWCWWLIFHGVDSKCGNGRMNESLLGGVSADWLLLSEESHSLSSETKWMNEHRWTFERTLMTNGTQWFSMISFSPSLSPSPLRASDCGPGSTVIKIELVTTLINVTSSYGLYMSWRIDEKSLISSLVTSSTSSLLGCTCPWWPPWCSSSKKPWGMTPLSAISSNVCCLWNELCDGLVIRASLERMS